MLIRLLFLPLFSLLFYTTSFSQTVVKPDVMNLQGNSSLRFATYNIAFNRKQEYQLRDELKNGESAAAKKIAEVIQINRPDVILLNEFDYDAGNIGIEYFRKKYLAIGQNGQKPIEFPFIYSGPVNTGVDSEVDLNNNGKTGEPNDAYGFGAFPGQYGMVVLSKFEIDFENVRTFQKFLWADMPGAKWPVDPKSEKPFYDEDAKDVFRLSSKSHWDIPIKVENQVVHFLVCHPTPPVFDGDEDRNGCRNHDEIRLFCDYVSGKAGYLYDDNGKKGGLSNDAKFVIAGDLNADPVDGDSANGAINQLLGNDFVNNSKTPESSGGAHWAGEQGSANKKHKGDPKYDTGDFNDRSVGNMRIDYVLPSKTLAVKQSHVFWPMPNTPGAKAVFASDHRMVCVDVELQTSEK